MAELNDGWDHAAETEEESAPPPTGKAPLIIGIVSVLAVLVVVGLVGFLVSQAGPSGRPTSEMTPTVAPLELTLPLTVGDLSRNPSDESSSELGEGDDRIEARSTTYVRERTDSLFVVIARPVTDPQEMLTLLDARAIREVTDGYCGRDSSDLDVCAVQREDVGILAAGLEGQTPEAIVADAKAIGEALERTE